LPIELLDGGMCAALSDLPTVWPWLGREHWDRWADWWEQNGRLASRYARIWRHVPQAVALRLVREGRLWPSTHPAWPLLWERAGDALEERVVDRLKDLPDLESAQDPRRWTVFALMESAPDSRRGSILARVREAMETSVFEEPAREVLRPWLHGYVASRRPGWREAFGVLAALLEQDG